MRIKIEVKYLNWDQPSNYLNFDLKPNENLVMGFLAGQTFKEDSYRKVVSFEMDPEPQDAILSEVFDLMNSVDCDDECTCCVPVGERSMCCGDLIYLDGEAFVVAPVGFKRYNQNT